MPHADQEFYAAERLATGVRGSLLAYTSGRVPSCRRPRSTGGARFLLNVSFKPAGQDWIGYDAIRTRYAVGWAGPNGRLPRSVTRCANRGACP